MVRSFRWATGCPIQGIVGWQSSASARPLDLESPATEDLQDRASVEGVRVEPPSRDEWDAQFRGSRVRRVHEGRALSPRSAGPTQKGRQGEPRAASGWTVDRGDQEITWGRLV